MRRVLVPGLMLLVVLAATSPAGAQSTEDDLEAVQQEIETLASQINTARAESARVGEQLAAAQARLSEVTGELGAAQANVDAIETQIRDQENVVAGLWAQIDALEIQLVETGARITDTEQRLSLQAVEMYMNASMSVGAVVLGFDTVDDLAVGMTYADDVAGESEDLLDTFEFLRAEEERQRDAVDTNRVQAEGVLDSLESERELLEAEAARVAELQAEAEGELAGVQAFLGQLRRDIAAAEQHKDGLEEAAERIEAEIAAARRTAGEAPGRLLMPADGWISSYFGLRYHPILGYARAHKGIDIAAFSGTPIRAAEAGIVIIAGARSGFGNTVVIDHGGGLTTLYAHQSRITVSVGEEVSPGERIGLVGCTGLCSGDHLHFEVHEGGTAVDPMGYLNG